MRSIAVLMVVCLVVGALFGIEASKYGPHLRITKNFQPTEKNNTKDITSWKLNENFDSSDELPTDWTTVDGDGDGRPWFIYEYNTHSEPNVAGSWYNASGNDDWLITPQITIESGDTLYCWYASQDPSWCDEHIQILVSTGTNDVSDFADTIFDYTTPDTAWREFVYGLDEYAGEDIYIAFRNISVDMFVLKVDDVRVGILPEYDAAVSAIDTLSPFYDVDDEITPITTVSNQGSQTIDVDVTCYIVHSEDTLSTELLTVTELAPGSSEDLTFSSFTLDISDAVYEIVFVAENEFEEEELEVDNISRYYAYTYTTPRMVLFQEFTATWCTWCPYPAVALHQLKQELGDSVVIASYHIWGEDSDPYWIGAIGENLAEAYGVGGIPATACNGSMYLIEGSTGDISNEYTLYSGVYDYIASTKTPITLSTTISSATETEFDVEATVDVVAELRGALDLRLFYVITETDIAYSWDPGEVPLDSLFDVVRAMLPSYEGVLVSGTSFTDNQTFTLDPSWNADNCYLITFVQDGINGEVFYAIEEKIITDDVKEKPEKPGILALECSPNPFNSNVEITVDIPIDGEMKLTVYDINGRPVNCIYNAAVESGRHNFHWTGTNNDNNPVPSGLYFVRLQTEKSSLTRRIVLVK